jgi:hypothetical protein
MKTRLARCAAALAVLSLPVLAGCMRSTPTKAAATSSPARISGKVYHAMPLTIDPDARYLIFLHGSLLEEEGTDATHPDYGRYAYDEIIEELLVPDTNVISVIRPPDTKIKRYAGKVVDQVEELLQAGVPPSHITVIGFSKGGNIAILASAELENEALNFGLLGACGEWLETVPESALMGRVLSIYDTGDDSAGSCQALFDRSKHGLTTSEVAMSTEAGHGAFYTPDSAWLEPLRAWLMETE